MNLLAIARLALALLGVLAAVQGLAVFPKVAASATLVTQRHGAAAALFAILLPFVLVWLISYYLVFRNLSLARTLTAQSHETPDDGTPRVLPVVVGLVGVLVLAYSLPGVIFSVGLLIAEGDAGAATKRLAAAHAAQVVLGLALFFRPDWFLGLWESQTPRTASV